MRTARRLTLALIALALIAAVLIFFPFWRSPPAVALQGDPERGAYVLRMGGCVSCHTPRGEEGAMLAGGRPLATPFGTIYASNITPDPETGIGGWSTGDFVLALTAGVSPRGHHYFPAFPYTSYTRMTEQDLVDLKAHLDTVEPVRNPVPAPEMGFPYNLRPLLGGWKLLFLEVGTFEPDPERSEAWNRGAYLVNGPTHCGECHTPRNALGGKRQAHFLAGNRDGPDGDSVPNITPHPEDGIGRWSKGDLTFALLTGILPDGDVFGGAMGEVVRESTGHLSQDDLDAIAEYLLSLPPLPDAEPRPPAAEGEGNAGSG
jgi:mono/diheme cytochrome c family protein